MDTIPPQEMTDRTTDRARVWRLVFGIAVVLVVGWLWVSWRSGWFPFGAQQTTQQEILNSLTATNVPTSSPAAVLETLTPTAQQMKTKTKMTAASTTSILDSLTPQK